MGCEQPEGIAVLPLFRVRLPGSCVRGGCFALGRLSFGVSGWYGWWVYGKMWLPLKISFPAVGEAGGWFGFVLMARVV